MLLHPLSSPVWQEKNAEATQMIRLRVVRFCEFETGKQRTTRKTQNGSVLNFEDKAKIIKHIRLLAGGFTYSFGKLKTCKLNHGIWWNLDDDPQWWASFFRDLAREPPTRFKIARPRRPFIRKRPRSKSWKQRHQGAGIPDRIEDGRIIRTGIIDCIYVNSIWRKKIYIHMYIYICFKVCACMVRRFIILNS